MSLCGYEDGNENMVLPIPVSAFSHLQFSTGLVIKSERLEFSGISLLT